MHLYLFPFPTALLMPLNCKYGTYYYSKYSLFIVEVPTPGPVKVHSLSLSLPQVLSINHLSGPGLAQVRLISNKTFNTQ